MSTVCVAMPLLFVAGCDTMSDPGVRSAIAQSNLDYKPSSYYQPQPVTSPSLVAPRVPVAPAAGSDLATLLEGCVIVANDGQFLGRITRNEVASDSILNEVGRYGSEMSSTSIFNQVGRYGSEVSRLSAFNEIARTPPQIISPSGQFVAYLTVNTIKTPAIDPRTLIVLLKSGR